MATKRFTDIKLGRDKWFRVLKPAMKCAVRFLFDECCEAGAWPIDEDAMEFYVGERIDIDALISAVNADGKVRIRLHGKDKLFIPGFIAFQYGELSPDCKPHLKVIRRLKELSLWIEYLKGLQTLEEEEEEKEKEEDKEKKGGAGGSPRPPIRFAIEPAKLQDCLEEWRSTLKHFEINRPVGERDELTVARAIQEFGSDWVILAFKGARKQTKGAKFDPKNFVSLAIYLHKDRIERLVNIGAGKESVEGLDWSDFLGGAT